MPSKTSQHIAFFIVLSVSAGLHWYVYANFRRVLVRDFPKIGRKLAKAALWMFVILDLPFFFIYFRGLTHAELAIVSQVLLYPFLVWQTIMLMWALILLPISVWRLLGRLVAKMREIYTGMPKRVRQETEEEIGLEVAAE